MQFLVVVVDIHDIEFALTIAAVPVTIIILLMAAYFTRKENTPGMILIIVSDPTRRRLARRLTDSVAAWKVLYFGGLAYFLFKLVRMYEPRKSATYLPVRKSLTTFAVITVILIILTIINACVCTHNFNRGLKPHVNQRKYETEEEKVAMTEMPNLAHGPVPSRMTID